jgi:sodium transport system permease protein
MNFRQVRLVFAREVRDQLRDQRTLFMIFALPVLLYPLLGMSVLQISQFMREQPSRILVVGAKNLDDLPPLFEKDGFAPILFGDPSRARLLQVTFAKDDQPSSEREGSQSSADQRAAAIRAMEAGKYDAVLFFPDDFAEKLDVFRQSIRQWSVPARGGDIPSPEIIYSTANEKSMMAFSRLNDVQREWKENIGADNLAVSGLPSSTARPFDTSSVDVAGESGLRGAASWAKILPILLILWAMTGAFYPAIDLCAGEKERGTLETLLSSPTRRSEIVLGKLGTIVLFSIATAVLNLVSMGITGWAVVKQIPGFGPPPLTAVFWLSLALPPVAVLFSALCLALAAFARSSKEGQYYLMPLILVTMPLVVLPMSPSVELNLGNSLIPITGLVLLLRGVLEGRYLEALEYATPVIAVTLACSGLAVRWAIAQFNSESVLFRASERLDLSLWLRHLIRQRKPTPGVVGAILCGVAILSIRFFLGLAASPPADFSGFALLALLTQLAVVAAPALVFAFLFATSPRQTLLLRRPSWKVLVAIPVAGLLAVALHPVATALASGVSILYPNESLLSAAKNIERVFQAVPFWQVLLVVAVAPAVCEELAFRGVILSGFRRLGHKGHAIIYTALFFGISHAILQQSVVAVFMGIALGYIAVQTGSILPCMTFHLVNNSLLLTISRLPSDIVYNRSFLNTVLARTNDGAYEYHWSLILAGAAVSCLLLTWFAKLPGTTSEEERLQAGIAGAKGRRAATARLLNSRMEK